MRKAYSYIRMSTDNQLKGDSLRRQLDASALYAQNNHLQLVDTINGIKLADLGVSAFNGKHTQKGTLALFLDKLDKGDIEPDSVLLVESLDRLSRERLSEALPQFLNIVNAGIEIVTLTDNQHYTKEILDNNPGALYISLGVMFRANEESEIKSKRIKSAWSNKRTKARDEGKALTAICPAWLKIKDDKSGFTLIEEKARIVRLIFDLCINSCGMYGVAQHLNQKGVPVFGRGKFWHRSYIAKILTNRAVLGEFHPTELISGKRTIIEDPIASYFPPVITEEKFLLARAAITRRTNNNRGRKGVNFSNILSGFTFCGRCGSRMALRNRGPLPKGGKWLVCSNKQVSGGCNAPEWKLNDVEENLFKHIREVSFHDLLSNDPSNEVTLENEIATLDSKKIDSEKKIARMVEAISEDGLIPDSKIPFVEKINAVTLLSKSIEKEIAEKKAELAQLKASRESINSEQLKEIIKTLIEREDDYLFRSTVNQHLARAILRLELHSQSIEYNSWEIEKDSSVVKRFKQLNPSVGNHSLEQLLKNNAFIGFAKQDARSMKIQYRFGGTRHVLLEHDASFYSRPQPRKSEQQDLK